MAACSSASPESVEDGNPHFRVLDKKHRIYARRDVPIAGIPLPAGPSSLALAMDVGRALRRSAGGGRATSSSRPRSGRAAPARTGATRPGATCTCSCWSTSARRPCWSIETTTSSICRPARAASCSTVPASRRATCCGSFRPTCASNCARRCTRRRSTGLAVESPPTAVTVDGSARRIALRVIPVRDGGRTFHAGHLRFPAPAGPRTPMRPPAVRVDADPLVQQLDHELRAACAPTCSDTVEQYERLHRRNSRPATRNCRRSTRELRSATEELETSREELQSINEELTTVNHELKSKVDELAHANSDMQNLDERHRDRHRVPGPRLAHHAATRPRRCACST